VCSPGACAGNSNQTWHTGGHIQGHYGTYYQLINNHTGQCLGIAGASTAQGANAVVWNCNGHHDQYWTWLTPGLPNVGVFIDQNSSLVLQITSGSSGGVVTQSYYGGGLGRQAWIF
jgi:Ricin-type beta-trefoil lectin domain-like